MTQKQTIEYDNLVKLGEQLWASEIPALHGAFRQVRKYIESEGLHITSISDPELEHIRYGGNLFFTEPRSFYTLKFNGCLSVFQLATPDYTIVKFHERQAKHGIPELDGGFSDFFNQYERDYSGLAIETLSTDEVAIGELVGLVRRSLEEDCLHVIDGQLMREEETLDKNEKTARKYLSKSSLELDPSYLADGRGNMLRKYMGSTQESRRNYREDFIRPILLLGQKYDLGRVIERATEVLESHAH
jgi:hypothetical protein